jgi:hypothetical protein
MTFEDLRAYYKTGYNFSKQTGLSAMNYSNWKNWGYIPLLSQIKIQRLTKGALKAHIEFKEDEI